MEQAPKFSAREDRLKPYLSGEIRDILFDELSETYCLRAGLDFLAGVPVPFRAADLASVREEGSLDSTRLADNMIRVMGADPHFRYNGAYLRYLARCFSEDLLKVVLHNGANELAQEHYRRACVYHRAALMLDGSDADAMLGYACCCRAWYLSLEGEDEEKLIRVLKDESQEYFEWCALLYPERSEAYYYLGYAYLNAGRYRKAEIVWRRYLSAAPESEKEARAEIGERLASLKDPVKIEAAVEDLNAGKIQEGLRVLEPYTRTSYASWWPLHWYLACAYRELDCQDEAIEGFRKVLSLSPSHLPSCEALAELYAQRGEAELAEKYRKKAELLRKNREESGEKP